jgi:FlaA1/EpsC-like NDP-sugar epimerase
MHTRLKIIGCGGHSKVVIDALMVQENPYKISLCDSNEQLLGTEIQGLIVDSTLESLLNYTGLVLVVIR